MRQKLGLGFVLAVLAAGALWFITRPGATGNALRIRELATRGLAEYLAGQHRANRVLIISNPFTQRENSAREIAQTEAAGVRGLQAGFGTEGANIPVAFPALRPEALNNPRALLGDRETSTPLSYLMQPEAIDQLRRQYPDRELFISLIGLPADLARCEAWTAAGPPRFALLWPDLRVIGDLEAVRAALKSGKLAAFVLRRPGAPDDAEPLSGNGEFGRRFVLVTAANVDQALQQFPGLLEGSTK